MPLHEKNDVIEDRLDDVYAAVDLSVSMPKYKIPDHEHDPRHVYSVVHDELMLDGNSRLNLATFCGTWVEPEIRQIMADTYDKNMIDKDEYPQTAEIESRCVHMLSDLWNSPEAANTIGCSTTGSSEACMLGGMALKWKWREKMQALGKPTDKPNIVMGVDVQVCWHKFARYWDIEERLIPMEGNRFCINAEEVIRRCDENTIGVVAIMGVTFTGEYEPVKEINDALDKLHQDTGLDVPIHVDAASGGFITPFIQPEIEWDFRLPHVKSINASGHKYGLAPLGVGWVVWREKEDLPEDLIFSVNYLGGQMPTFAINFSRPGGQIIAQYYNFLRLGKEGYRKIQQSCQDVAVYLAERIDKLGPFECITRGADIPVFCWRIKKDIETGFTLFDFADRLRYRGWQVPAYTMPQNRQDLTVQRVVVRHGFSRDLADLLLDDMKRALQYFAENPITKPAIKGKLCGFNHT
ncbi:MAG: glutamate decarboxylase [Pseudomonadota bacterium]